MLLPMLFLRSLIFNLFLYSFTAVSSILVMALAVISPRHMSSFARRWSCTWLRVYELMCGVSYEVRGQEHVPSGGCIIAMKHQSTWDTFALFAVFRAPVFVFKRELAYIPFFGWALIKLGFIPVKLGAGKAAVDSIINGATVALGLGKQVVIFPEGTRSAIGQAPHYKSGVSHLYSALNIACLPVALNSGVLWPRRKFLRPPGVITVEILAPVKPGLERREMFSILVDQIETASSQLCDAEIKKS
jgi:1-acyl-sn-glycerol-3-phosphate acyltransferase